MKPLLPFLLVASLFSLYGTGASAQQSPVPVTTPAPTPKTTLTFFGGALFASRLHYYGRTDSLKSNAVIPTILIQFDSAHLYLSGSAIFLNNSVQHMEYAGTVLEGGYRFGKLKGFAGNVYVNKFFYDTRQLPQSALKAQTGANLSYLNKYVNITGSGSVAFEDKADFFASGGLNHIFKWKKNKTVFLLTPTFVANAGSQNFTNSYYKANPVPGFPGQEVLQNSNRFTLLSYETSVPIVVARKHIFFIATPSYVIPQNVISVSGHPELSEKASNLFYTNLTLLFSFKK